MLNFAKYDEVNEEQFDSYKQLNVEGIERVTELSQTGKLADTVYICNSDYDKQLPLELNQEIQNKFLLTV